MSENYNYVDQYDLAVLRNETDLTKIKLNNAIKRLEDCESHIVNYTVDQKVIERDNHNEIMRLDKMIQGGLEVAKKKQQEKNEAFHVNLMLVQNDVDKVFTKLNREIERRYNVEIFISLVFSSYLLFRILNFV